MTTELKMPMDPFGPPLRHLSAAQYEAWLLDYAWPSTSHIKREKSAHTYGEPFSLFPEKGQEVSGRRSTMQS